MNPIIKKLCGKVLPLALLAAGPAYLSGTVCLAGVGDPQIKTDHPWYPGELSCSTFERLFKTQAEIYTRVTGRPVDNDEDKVLASWYFRSIYYHHCTECLQDNWGNGVGKSGKAEDTVMREYWNGLFGYGFGICFETHDQWHGEMIKLLGPSRSRTVGVDGHTTFEVFIKGGVYGEGQWVLLDHDIATIVFDPTGKRMLSVLEIAKDMSLLKKADKSRGWPIGGLAAEDVGGYHQVKFTGAAAGFAGAPPMVHLRSGETLRRYTEPGLDDGQKFVFWGMNIDHTGKPGPSRDRTFVNQPEKLYKNPKGSGSVTSAGRYGNAVYTYKPDFASGKYKEGVIDESDSQVTFEFYTPYVIAATPTDVQSKKTDALYAEGAKGGLVLKGNMPCTVEVSVDQGKTWSKPQVASDGMDLTDQVKGCRQYWIRLGAAPAALANAGLVMQTVCQCNAAIIPHLKEGKNTVTFEASGQAVVDVGPNKPQELAHIIDGALDSPSVTLEIATPRHEPAVALYVSGRQSSGVPPKDVAYNIDYSTDGGKEWKSVVKDFKIQHLGEETKDFWSQSFTQGDCTLDNVTGPIQVRFTNNGKKNFMQAEAHLVYKTDNSSPLKVTFAWKEGAQQKSADHTYAVTPGQPDASWTIDAGKAAKVGYVEYACP